MRARLPTPARSLLLALTGLFLLVSTSQAGNLRVRLREHFDWLSVRYGGDIGEQQNYFGTSNTANIWYEEPLHYGFGLAFGPILGSAKSNGHAPSGTDARIRLWNFGLEFKYFFFPQKGGFFGRVGLGGNALDTRGSGGTLWGGHYYLGAGWEFKVWKLGLSPEIAFRHVLLERNGQALAFTPSIGVHFYVLPDDSQD